VRDYVFDLFYLFVCLSTVHTGWPRKSKLRYCGVFCNYFITNFPQIVPVKNFENRSLFGEDIDKSVGYPVKPV